MSRMASLSLKNFLEKKFYASMDSYTIDLQDGASDTLSKNSLSGILSHFVKMFKWGRFICVIVDMEVKHEAIYFVGSFRYVPSAQ